jgi:hypothetical protein
MTLFIISFIIISMLAVAVSARTFLDTFKEGFKTIADIIYYIFGLQFLGIPSTARVAAFLRINLWFMIFAIVFELTNKMLQNKRVAAVIGISLAFLTTFSLTPTTILTIGGILGFFVAFILIAIPLIIIGFAIFGISGDTRFKVMLKIICLLIAIWLLSLAQPLFSGEVQVLYGPRVY